MRFLYPEFLFALAAVAIPILIHLFNFRKFKKIQFSNLRFLKQVQQATSSGRKLKDRLILAARILAITFLVLAFAKPYISSGDQDAGGRQVVSVYIDNSFSMESVNKEGTLLDEAKRRAAEIASAYSLNDRFQLLTNDFEGKHQRLVGYDDFINALQELKISSTNRDIREVVARQLEVFAGEPNARKTIYQISDFQESMLGKGPVRADSQVTVRLVKLSANPLPNVSIDSVWLTSPLHQPGKTEQLIVKLRNNSDEKAQNIPVKVFINNSQKAISTLSVEPRATITDTLAFSGLGAGWQRGYVQIKDYPVVFDDTFYFSFHVRQSIPVLLVNGTNPNPFLQAVYRSDPFFSLVQLPAGSIDYSTLPDNPMVVLNEIRDYTPGFNSELKAYVQNGGTLFIYPSLEDDLSGLGTFLQELGADRPESVVSAETKVSKLNTADPLFADVFEQVPRNMELPLVRKYIAFASQSRSNRQSVIDLAGNRSLLSRFNLGGGKVYVSAVPLDDSASNLQRHSVFVPIMFQAAMQSVQQQRLFYQLNNTQLINIPKVALRTDQVLKLKKRDFEAIPQARQSSAGTEIFMADQIRENGNFDLMKNDSLIAVLSFNDNRTESDLSYADEDELKDKFPYQKVNVIEPAAGSVENQIKAVNSGLQLWKFFLVLALLALAAEIALIRFYKTSSKITS